MKHPKEGTRIMYCTNIATRFEESLTGTPRNVKTAVEHSKSRQDETLTVALHLLENGRAQQADELLTAAVLEDPADPELWLAAGICRLRRGAVRSAEVAFEMSSWLDDSSGSRR